MNQDILRILEFPKIQAMLLQRTHFSWGKELAQQTLPAFDFATVEERLNETEEARTIIVSEPSVPFGGILDIRSAVRRAGLGSVLDPEEIMAVGNTLSGLRRLKAFLERLELPVKALLTYRDELIPLRPLEQKIEAVLDEQARIRDEASSELSRIRREMRSRQSQVKSRLDAILRSAEYQKYFQDAIVTVRGDRYVIPVKQEYRHHFPGIVHDQSGSGATVFIEPMALVTINNEIKQLLAAEKHEIERILTLLSGEIGRYSDSIYQSAQAAAALDAIFARALLSLDMKAYRPQLNSEGYINLVNARHPLIDGDSVVPISVRLGQEFQTLLITGPNTGGKTVTLKLVGLFALMTQAGLFIPAMAESAMPVFPQIFVDIGDEQSIEQSLSTFSGHMTHLVKILDEVRPGDLVLIDEIGAGTDPDEGAALAMSILERLHKLDCRTIVTTHYSELKTFAFSREGIENASVEFDIETLRPTYRLIIGRAGSSNAFAISARLGLSEVLIDRAKALITQSHADFESVLAKLEQKTVEYEQRNEELAALEREINTLKHTLDQERTALAVRRKDTLDKSKKEAAAILRQARRTAEEVIEEIKKQFSEKEQHARQKNIHKSRQKLAEGLGLVNDFSSDETDLPPLDSAALAVGMTVKVLSLNQKGVILAINGNDLLLQVGILKMNVPLADCRMTNQPARESRTLRRVKPPKVSLAVQAAARQIDVRGTTVEEAQEVIDKFIDDAIMAGLGEVLVIHGKGTGALRKGLREYLKQHPSVKKIDVAELNEGGDGATAVKLK
ncbi:MAG: endonuclease MutS2 [Sporomusaceae bacterium]|nr:endonuclease MutS2 [Sporomusaceae bacterium]